MATITTADDGGEQLSEHPDVSVGCGRTGKMVVAHYPVANEYSTVQEFDTRIWYTGILQE